MPRLPRAARRWSSPAARCACAAWPWAAGGCRRSRYRPDPWRWPEWVVAGCGVRRRWSLRAQHRLRPRRAQPGLYAAALAGAAARPGAGDPAGRRSPAVARLRRHRCSARRRDRPADAPGPAAPEPVRRQPVRGGRDQLRPRHGHLRRRGRPRCCATSTCDIDEGELCLVVGRTGVGQVHAARRDQRAGAALHRRHARRAGSRVDGRDTAHHPPRELADVVGVVGQDPLAGLRHRHRRGGARLRHGAARACRPT